MPFALVLATLSSSSPLVCYKGHNQETPQITLIPNCIKPEEQQHRLAGSNASTHRPWPRGSPLITFGILRSGTPFLCVQAKLALVLVWTPPPRLLPAVWASWSQSRDPTLSDIGQWGMFRAMKQHLDELDGLDERAKRLSGYCREGVEGNK
ncbi:hypothetical protein B0T17DRAFT_505466 [Bombardia bombarda]|uniref:Uncharacterized protein n=1 Tax=Bombardia bombarda TaxID=252184 RepID=A0AA39X8T1_9PEZI|nr:hypothetical protein B0T17DRAFT_505466 [Bombardia bombarda]